MAKTTVFFVFLIFVGCMVCVQGSGCEEYGECGLNGICEVVKGSSHCRCPAGFDIIDKSNPSKGCFQRPSQQTKKCITSGGKMVNEGNIDWGGNDYETMTSVNQAACTNACLDDCFCTAVISATLNGTDYCWKSSCLSEMAVQVPQGLLLLKYPNPPLVISCTTLNSALKV